MRFYFTTIYGSLQVELFIYNQYEYFARPYQVEFLGFHLNKTYFSLRFELKPPEKLFTERPSCSP